MSKFSFLLVLTNQLINCRNLNSKGIKTPKLVIKADLRVQEVTDHDEVERPNGQHEALLLVPDIRKEKQIETHVVDQVRHSLFSNLLSVMVVPGKWHKDVHDSNVLGHFYECVLVPWFFTKVFT